MHRDEVEVSARLVRRLLASQCPHLADLPVTRVHSTGTVNAIYRLGEELCVRLPRVQGWAADLDTELAWLPRLAPVLPLDVPHPVHEGEPDQGFPFRWAVYEWLPGATFDEDALDDLGAAAGALSGFVHALRRVDTNGAPRCRRSRPLEPLDPEVRAAIAAIADTVNVDAVTTAWEASLRGRQSDASTMWCHGDLLRPNVLIREGRVSAVLDFGSAGVGDPAVDVIPAWAIFGKAGRHLFRAALEVDDATWLRARGLALHQALMIIPYYRDTNPGFVASARRTVEQVLADLDG